MNNKDDRLVTTDPQLKLELVPNVPIPEYLVGEVQSKLAYVDEWITQAHVSSERITLDLVPHVSFSGDLDRLESGDQMGLTPQRRADLEEKVQRVVLSMAKGAIKPKVQVLEDHMDRPLPYQDDPMPERAGRSPSWLIEIPLDIS